MTAKTGPVPFGRYQLLHELGRGGMAEVFLAQLTQGEVARYLAIKRLLPAYSTRPEIVERLAAEARLTVWLTHPNIVQVYDFGRVGDDYYIAMEYVDGCDLRALLRPGRGAPGVQLPMEVAVEIAYRLLDALRYAHSCSDDAGRVLGIIHRDVSPHNILIARDGYPKLADFGVARARAAMAVSFETQPGAVLGKYNYMAPEQASGGEYDARVDLYAAGATLYQMLTGERPFRDRGAQLKTGVFRLPRPPSELRPSIPRSLDELVLRAMAPSPADRFQSASQMAAALLQELPGLGGPPKPHQLRGVVAEALRVRGGPPELDALAALESRATAEHSLIGEQVTAVRRATRSGILSVASIHGLIRPVGIDAARGASDAVSEDVTDVGSVMPEPKEAPTLPPRLPLPDELPPRLLRPDELPPTAPWQVAVRPLVRSGLLGLRGGESTSGLQRWVPRALVVGVALLLFGLGLLLGRSLPPLEQPQVAARAARVDGPPPRSARPAATPSRATRPVEVAASSEPTEAPVVTTGASQPSRPRARPRPSAGRGTPRARGEPVSEAKAAADAQQAMELLRGAQQAFVAGDHPRAVSLSLKALRLKPESTAALQIWGAASCYLKRERDARTAASRLRKASRDMLRQVCERQGIRL